MTQAIEKDNFEVMATQEEEKDSQSPMFTPEPIPETPMILVQETERDLAEAATVHPPSDHLVTRKMNTRSTKAVMVSEADQSDQDDLVYQSDLSDLSDQSDQSFPSRVFAVVPSLSACGTTKESAEAAEPCLHDE